ncbi:MAG: selenium metabolism-associated LysR family transcriptional regulator [Peptoniphilaceae bacterium]|nr:selenium metabolism-associated LysR family transcriptional regulator [Peptoniphilaceae bacterium]MDY6018608.1 selenium metabolism-associated LysR family transcriptional regulator [Anaerococcus sp.]
MEFKQLEVYIKLVEIKSFSQTAKALDISQPSVSTIVKNLEEELETKLFIRSTKEIEVTKKGQILYESAKNLLDQRDNIIEELTGQNNKQILIGASSVPSEYMLTDYLKYFKEKYPHINTAVFESNSKTVIEKVKNHDLDVGFVGMKEDKNDLAYVPIYRDKLVYIAKNDDYHKNLLDKNPPIETLLQEALILREEGSGTNELFKNLLNDLNIDYNSLNISLRANKLDLIKNMVKDGLGSAFVSKISISDLDQEDFLVYDIDMDTTRDFYMIYDQTYPLNSQIKCFVDFIKDNLNK